MKSDPLPKLRKICLAFPGAFEKLSHGEPAWFAPKRMFAMFANNSDEYSVVILLGLDWGMVATLLKQAYDLSAAPRKARRSV